MNEFAYAAAFTRNIGWVMEWEQDALRGKRVAIAGLGGVGGAHLLTLTRLGVGAFSIADFDEFGLANFNRQVGATVGSIGRPKLDVMAEMALSVNPTLQLRRFAQGVTTDNLDHFLDDVDLYVDGLDFFELNVRRAVFRRCAELGIPAITAAPIGMGTHWLIFAPGGMSFEQYFRFEGQGETEQYLRFLIGLAPSGVHRKYLVDPSRVDLQGKAGPSTGASCTLCAGVVGVEAVKLLLGRGKLHPAPTHHFFDPYAGRYGRTRLRWGVAGPLQRLKLAIARRFYLRQLAAPRVAVAPAAGGTPIERILDAARWAPSGDNAQPWRFHVIDDEHLTIEFRNEAAHNPYEYREGEPSLLSLGMLIETMRLAASAHGRTLDYALANGSDGDLSVAIRLELRPGLRADPLEAFITSRSVHRRALRTRALTTREKTALQGALGPELTISWYETPAERWRVARLGARVSDIRLRAPEFFPVHQRVIDWRNHHSPGGLPAAAIGLDPATLRIMRWAMQSWRRMAWINRLSGTFASGVQLDLVPGMRSAAFFSIAPTDPSRPATPAATIATGQAVQRLWLTAQKLGLALQPATALLMMAHYGASETPFTTDAKLLGKAQDVARSFAELFGPAADRVLFVGRVGERLPGPPRARSVRHPLTELVAQAQPPRAAPAAA